APLLRRLPRTTPQTATTTATRTQTRTLIAAPKPGSGPLLERRSDRALPDVQSRPPWRRSLPIFTLLVAAASLAIFNYQKSSSPVTAGTLYALRMSPKARAVLGDNIYFDQQIPWIRGGMNQVQGRIDIKFAVRGTKGTGVMRFVSHRPTPRGVFETTEWTLETEDGRKIDLLEEGDPFKALTG
ncbi:cytochrome oxidase complex assembly protein 1-domain-containing protein, partial [Cercophora newfieldiana]